MAQANALAIGSLILLATMVEPCASAEQKFSCKGQLIRGASPDAQPKQIDLNVTLGEGNKLSMKTGEGMILSPRRISDNKIQLRFATKEFVGEYFHYTGDLFLIYSSGELARLNCLRT
jgi:hypothetical protein